MSMSRFYAYVADSCPACRPVPIEEPEAEEDEEALIERQRLKRLEILKKFGS